MSHSDNSIRIVLLRMAFGIRAMGRMGWRCLSMTLKHRNLYVFSRRRNHCGEEGFAFTTVDGSPLDSSGFRTYLRKVTGVRCNAEYNGFICRGLLAARNAALSS